VKQSSDKPVENTGMGSATPFHAPSLSLPKGGGAIRGIGEKFSTNLSAGTASLSIPLAASPGRAGFDLQLAVGYDSGAGNGPFGLGWHLSVPAITRKTDKGLPQYLDAEESDVFVLSGAEDLVPVRSPEIAPRDGYRIQRYRPRIEGLFARIERWTHEVTGEAHWRIITRDNVTNLYGQSGETRIADPDAPERVFSWLLEETRDDRGNIARYTYRAEDGAGVDPTLASEVNRFEPMPDGSLRFRATAQRYLERIEYGNRLPGDLSEFLFEVVFDYGEHDSAAPTPTDATSSWPVRRDPFSNHRPGFEVRTYRLCRRVLMFHRFAELGAAPCLVRSTDFTYDESAVLTYLTEVEQARYRRKGENLGYTRAALPPLTLDYPRLTELSDVVTPIDRASLQGIPGGVDGTTAQWVDLDGEGLAGVLEAGERGWYYKANLGEGKLAPPVALRSLPIPAELSGGYQQLTDLQGDGNLDLVRYAQPLSGYFARTDDGGWEPFAALREVPTIDWNDANLRSVDLDGDGFPDVLITEHEAFVWYRSRAQEGFESARRVLKAWDENKGPAVVFADGTESIHLADMSGDGLSDLVRVRNREVCYWPNLGYGRFGPKVTMDRSPNFDHDDQFDPRRIRFADVDGSGTTDILYLSRNGVAIFLNQSGNGLKAPQLIRTLPVLDALSGTTVTDLLGRGTACLVWSSPAPGNANRPAVYIDLMGGKKPHLLISSKNNLGAETHVEYAPSTRFYLADKAAGTPWITRLPFPVHVVERVITFDRISKNRFVTRYAYHHGYFDSAERELRGFGRVDQWDTEELGMLTESGDFPAGTNIDAASYVPPVRTQTWFHTGAFADGARISRLFEAEYYRNPDVDFLEDTVLDPAWSAEETREACRALKGSILRQEVYAEDGSSRSVHPYSVSERNYTIVRLQPKGDERHGVFFAHPRETIDFHYERNPADPRISHALTLEVDDFGNVTKSAAVSYGRRQPDTDLAPEHQRKQTQRLATYTENGFTNFVDEDDVYLGRLPCETRTYELTGLTLAPGAARFSFDDLVIAAPAAAALAYEQAPTAGRVEKRTVEHVRTLYRRDNLEGPLELGVAQAPALPYESYKLAFTPGLVTTVYGTRVNDAMLVTDGGYVHSQGDDNWWIPSGRVFYSRGADDTPADELDYARRHFFLPCRFQDPFGQSTTIKYDAYDLLVQETRDALGNLATVGTRDPLGELVASGSDYRVLQPALMMDANRNRAAVAFDTLGMVVGTAVMGKPEENLGDSLDGFEADLPDDVIAAHLADPLADPHAILQRATTRLVYDLGAYRRARGVEEPPPAVVYTLARETHDSDLVAQETTKVQHGFSYSDGFGREIQKKMQAEPGPLEPGGPRISPRWVGSGWTIFNNKGKPVRKYEPFFSPTHTFELAKIKGVSTVLFYDPVDRVVATLHPDHTYEKLVFDAWRQVTSGVSDNVLRADPKSDPDVGDFFRRLPEGDYLPTWHEERRGGALGAEERTAAERASLHADTPAKGYFDALGRPFLTVAHNRFQRPGEPIVEEMYGTVVALDIEGNQRSVTDAKGRVVMRYSYDMLATRGHQASMEAGARWTFNDVAGKPIYTWDSRGHTFRTTYDELRRPKDAYVTGADVENPTREILYEKIEYGEDQPSDVALNLRTRAFRQYDGAGLVTQMGRNPETLQDEAYDFKGNPLRSSRQLAVEYKGIVDWLGPVMPPLNAGTYAVSTTYDALNRPVSLTTPDQSRIRPTYSEANLLQRIDAELRGAATQMTFVENIDYNEKGQRTLIEYGNQVRTGYTYDRRTFRLRRLVTTRGAMLPEDCLEPLTACGLQNLSYTYDPAGNISHIRDSAQQTTYFANARVEPVWEYVYDAVDRLIEATGREHLGQVGGVPVPTSDSDAPRVGLAHPNDRNAMGLYSEQYIYDGVGNILQMAHRGTDPGHGGWTRLYSYDEESQLESGETSNRLSTTQTGHDSRGIYTYDAHGNMVTMPHLPLMRWDCRDRLEATSKQVVDNGGTPETTHYVYDSSGQRVRKVTEFAAGVGEKARRKDERIYLGGFEIYRKYDGADDSTPTLERETLHVTDDKQRIAMVETRTRGEDGSPEQVVRYQIGNHLGSACVEIDGDAQIISYEEYYPYGSTSYQARDSQTEAPRKRYRYTGKERDEETGLGYHGRRYYVPWLGRWSAADPAGLIDGPNLYRYARNCPIVVTDPTGLNPPDPRPFGTFEEFRSATVEPYSDEYLRELWDSRVQSANHPGTLRVSGIRTPMREGQTLAPREHYNNGIADAAAAEGYVHWAELVEAGQGCAACHVTHDLNRIPTDAELNLTRYNAVSYGLFIARHTTELVMGVGGLRAAQAERVAETLAGRRQSPPPVHETESQSSRTPVPRSRTATQEAPAPARTTAPQDETPARASPATPTARTTGPFAWISRQWGRNRLIKELHDRGFRLEGPTRRGGGLIYQNEAGDRVRIMPRPVGVRPRSAPPAKYENSYYYRYAPANGRWGPHTTLPDPRRGTIS
jgi:RHS repeat-associated protein